MSFFFVVAQPGMNQTNAVPRSKTATKREALLFALVRELFRIGRIVFWPILVDKLASGKPTFRPDKKGTGPFPARRPSDRVRQAMRTEPGHRQPLITFTCYDIPDRGFVLRQSCKCHCSEHCRVCDECRGRLSIPPSG